MRSFLTTTLLFATLVSLTSANIASGQLIQQTVPNQNIGSSFFENNGVQWNVNGPGFFANFGGGAVTPPFGNFTPNSGLQTGVGISGGGFSGGIGLNLSQGSSRSNVSTSASLTTMDGMPGYISSQTVRPFVTGVTPVVGGQAFASSMPPLPPSPTEAFREYQQSQMADLQRRNIAHHESVQKKAQTAFERGQRAEESGNLRMARANYQNALRTAQGQLRVAIQMRMQARGW
ncbi:hypothetical protein [Aporhodopirellula aestuarii]|uniref:Uncharacterized protein n=1 Tax=Aporhodopirellula aestuarii TaxID=2950107 RepID=A0ABT0U4G9_9BACT|nr:hypothetical protein [Aporhodopirellula aestuarii]MCM2371793.1 hypothetical protein [Aporhodopirellula aestuarii]